MSSSNGGGPDDSEPFDLRGSRDLMLLCRQLGVMLNAGTDILRALAIAGDNISQPALRQAFETARSDMSLGSTLARSLSRYPHLFSPFFIDMIRQGEGEGTLGNVLQSLSDYLEKDLYAPLAFNPTPGTPSGFPASGYPASGHVTSGGRAPGFQVSGAPSGGPILFGPGVPGSGYRLSMFAGAGVVLAATLWSVLVSAGYSTAGTAAVWGIGGVALALWGAGELRRSVGFGPPASGADPGEGDGSAGPAGSALSSSLLSHSPGVRSADPASAGRALPGPRSSGPPSPGPGTDTPVSSAERNADGSAQDSPESGVVDPARSASARPAGPAQRSPDPPRHGTGGRRDLPL